MIFLMRGGEIDEKAVKMAARPRTLECPMCKSTFERNGRGWIVDKFLQLDLNIVAYTPKI